MPDNLNILDGSQQGALVLTSGTVTITDNATTTIPFASESYDRGNWHDTDVSLNTRLTVPAGFGKIRLAAQIGFSSAAGFGSITLEFTKNGSTSYDGLATFAYEEPNVSIAQLMSPVLEVVEGDFFEFDVTLGVFGANKTADNNLTWFNAIGI